jgi:hypothetical protein
MQNFNYIHLLKIRMAKVTAVAATKTITAFELYDLRS